MIKKILIFGGSGFIGCYLVKQLIKKNYQICIICTDKNKAKKNLGQYQNLVIKNIDIFDQKILQETLKDYDIIINLIGKLFERKKDDFDKFHHQFPELLAKNILKKQKLIHISALAIENSSKSSLYAKTKLKGEQKIIKHCLNYNIVKPSIVFGQKDNFFNQFAKMAKISPFLPLIAGGKSKFTPIYVKDLTKSIIFLIEDKKYNNQIFEAYGPKIANFKELLQFILKIINKRRILLNLPFVIAQLQAKFLNLFKIYLLTPDQVELLKYDNIMSSKYSNIDQIIGKLESYENIVPKYLNKK